MAVAPLHRSLKGLQGTDECHVELLRSLELHQWKANFAASIGHHREIAATKTKQHDVAAASETMLVDLSGTSST